MDHDASSQRGAESWCLGFKVKNSAPNTNSGFRSSLELTAAESRLGLLILFVSNPSNRFPRAISRFWRNFEAVGDGGELKSRNVLTRSASQHASLQLIAPAGSGNLITMIELFSHRARCFGCAAWVVAARTSQSATLPPIAALTTFYERTRYQTEERLRACITVTPASILSVVSPSQLSQG